MTEEEVREKISRWKEKYENLLSSTWQGGIGSTGE